MAIVHTVVADCPRRIWCRFGKKSAISLKEFQKYFSDLQVGYAIVFREIRGLRPILSLKDIRERVSTFHPPQFAKRLASDSPELTFFRSALMATGP
ncbi:MAG: hypothetical protein ACHQ50_16045, partial [Fimbriimonadales bacterium]